MYIFAFSKYTCPPLSHPHTPLCYGYVYTLGPVWLTVSCRHGGRGRGGSTLAVETLVAGPTGMSCDYKTATDFV